MARKKLNADARAFLTGDQLPVNDELPTPNEPLQAAEPKVETSVNEPVNQQNLLSEILGSAQQSEAVVRYTADLPESLHQRLSYAAVTSKTTKIKLLRQILDKVLPQLPT